MTTVGVLLPLAGCHVTLLSVLVDAAFVFPARSLTPPALILAITSPAVVMPLTLTSNVVWSPLSYTLPISVPPAVLEERLTSLFWTDAGSTGSLNTKVNLIGAVLVGSAWVAAWLIVTVGAVWS